MICGDGRLIGCHDFEICIKTKADIEVCIMYEKQCKIDNR